MVPLFLRLELRIKSAISRIEDNSILFRKSCLTSILIVSLRMEPDRFFENMQIGGLGWISSQLDVVSNIFDWTTIELQNIR